MAKVKPQGKKETFSISSLSLTSEDEKTLDVLRQEATDYLGRTVSRSAIVRALLRVAAKHGYQWVIAEVYPFVEAEISSSIVWGKKK
jgi:DNA-binding NarL/FixJ family response regulator